MCRIKTARALVHAHALRPGCSVCVHGWSPGTGKLPFSLSYKTVLFLSKAVAVLKTPPTLPKEL